MDIKVYGIKTWDSVRKALRFFKDNNLEVEFFDTKKEKSFGEILGYKNKSDFYELLQKASLRAKEQKWG